MIIISKDKTIIANFNNILVIAIDKDHTKRRIFCKGVDSTEIILGEYDTEERTEEVFKELMEATTSLFESYYMPKN